MNIDKFLHIVTSFMIAQVDVTLSFVLGIGKELWDLGGNGGAELADLMADWAGIILAILS